MDFDEPLTTFRRGPRREGIASLLYPLTAAQKPEEESA